MSKIKILIVDDHTILRTGLRLLINAQTDLEVVGEAMNGQEALKKITELNPDVTILDISMPNTNSITLIGQILKSHPNMKILVLTMHDDLAYVRATLSAGALGYITKEVVDTELLSAIRIVYQGQMSIYKNLGTSLLQELLKNPPNTTKQPNKPKSLLSNRENEILQLLAKGFTNKQIAEQIHVSTKTVESYRLRLGEKLGLRTRSDFTLYAFKMGILTPNSFT
ncbi:MAG: LuxR family transcriptional regulator [bacterium]|nr:MAG: LuxR family transcriptional regulator [bacterium]